MIQEMATILIKPGKGEEFEHNFALAVPLFQRAKGYQSIRLERSVEVPLRYVIVIGWETLEDHVIGFRNSDDHRQWRELVGDLFAAPPSVDHTATVVEFDASSGRT
jgi:heme-degrading monooxygenase HmoA